MKKKFLSIVSLILAATMLFPTAALAEGEGQVDDGAVSVVVKPELVILNGENRAENIKLFTYSTKVGTVDLDVPEGYEVIWMSSNDAVAVVDPATGVVTAKAEEADSVTITAIDKTDSTKTAACVIEVAPRACTRVEISGDTIKNTYVSGQNFDTTGMTVKAKYNDEADLVTVTDYQIKVNGEANRPLKASDNAVTVVVDGIPSAPFAITVTERTVSAVKVLYPKTSYTEGDKIKDLEVEVSFNDGDKIIMTSGFEISITEALKTTDTSYYVTYQNVKSDAVSIKVAAKTGSETTTPDGSGNSGSIPATGNVIVYEGEIPTEYEVGDKVDFSKVTKFTLYKDGVAQSTSSSSIKSALEKKNTAFTTKEIGDNTSVTFTVTVSGTSGSVAYTLKLTGLKVTEGEDDPNKEDDDGPYAIEDVEMKKDKYEVGYEFTLEDIKYVEVTWNKKEDSYDIPGDELEEYEADPSLEVLSSDGERKALKSYRDQIQESDVTTDKRGNKFATLRLTFGDEEYDFEIEVGSDPVRFIHGRNDTVIASYDDIEDALDATVEQDKDVDTDDFDLESDVTSNRPITLKLGEDAELDDDYEYDPEYPVIIDLNGYTLTIYSSTVDLSKANDGNLTITNSSSTAGKVIYDDLDVTVTVAKDEELVFEYDADVVPGLYVVEVTAGKNGTVTSKPSMDKSGKIEAGAGTEITFTITPAKNYQLDTIKADGKTVSASAYSKATSGVITYKYKVGEDDGEIEVTFKEVVVEKEAWENPYTDVSDNATYIDAVQFVTENKLINGTSTDSRNPTFSPDKTLNRATFVTILGRLAGVDTSKYTKSSFIDVPLDSSTSWYAPYVEWANERGIILGYGNGKFGPLDPITREQVYIILYRYMIFVENKVPQVSTVRISASDKSDLWQDDTTQNAVKFATANDLLLLNNGYIKPKQEAKRWELASILMDFCVNVLGMPGNE